MKSAKGFTLIELMIVIAIIGIVAAMATPMIMGSTRDSADWSATTGWVEQRCIGGYKFVKAQRGSPTQILDEHGHGVKCQ